MEEPTRLELVNSRFAIYGLTNLAIAPKVTDYQVNKHSFSYLIVLSVVPEAGLEPAQSQ